jgi:hypothetical protein
MAAGATIALGLALVPAADRLIAARAMRGQLDAIALAPGAVACGAEGGAGVGLDAQLAARSESLGGVLASWQTVGGCGASAATGGGVGVKWVGRGVSGGVFNVQCQANYSAFTTNDQLEKHYALNTLITRDLGDWIVGFNVPYVYKYLNDPYGTNVDLSNGGWGDVNLQVTRKLGPINATMLTATVGLPTGQYDARYKMKLLRQHQQLGFGKATAALSLDHTMDELWGQTVLGGVASWRGGENAISNYRAPSASLYGYTGYFLGPFFPAMGLSLTGFTAHDRDQDQDENTGLGSAAANVSIEWSTTWIALQLGASFPYQYDGITVDSNGRPKSPWGWGPWIVALGVQIAP